MKIGGRTIKGVNIFTRVFPRENSEPIVLKMAAVLDMDEFDKNYPAPEPPTIIFPDGRKAKDIEAKKYKEAISDYSSMRFNYMVLKSLQATEGLEWDTVDMSKPETWGNYVEDLKNADFSTAEQTCIINDVFNVNSLNDEKLKSAKADFIRSQSQASADSAAQSSLKVEPGTTESGEPVNV
jgi:hypothetical protein